MIIWCRSATIFLSSLFLLPVSVGYSSEAQMVFNQPEGSTYSSSQADYPNNQYGYTVTSKIATPALLKLIDKYFNTIGVYPREFLSWSDKEREAYVRGLLDNEVLWGKAMGKPRMDGLMICFNTKISQIISQAKNFVMEEGEYETIMPWTLARLVGFVCREERDIKSKKTPKYLQATTEYVLLDLAEPGSTEEEDENNWRSIRKIFLRGALDAKVFTVWPSLFTPDPGRMSEYFTNYYTCLLAPGTLDGIHRAMSYFTLYGDNIDKPYVYSVVMAEELQASNSKHPSCQKIASKKKSKK